MLEQVIDFLVMLNMHQVDLVFDDYGVYEDDSFEFSCNNDRYNLLLSITDKGGFYNIIGKNGEETTRRIFGVEDITQDVFYECLVDDLLKYK